MARHRNVRTMNYEDEFYDDDDYLGHSVEDNYCISPGTAAQFTFSRENANLSSFMENERIPEEENEDDSDLDTGQGSLNSSKGSQLVLSDIDRAKLNSCSEEMRSVLGDSCPDHVLHDTIIRNNFNIEAGLNEILSSGEAAKPQRAPRQNRRNRSQAFAPNPPTVELKSPPQFKKKSTKDSSSNGSKTDPQVVKISNSKKPVTGFNNTPSKPNEVVTTGNETSKGQNAQDYKGQSVQDSKGQSESNVSNSSSRTSVNGTTNCDSTTAVKSLSLTDSLKSSESTPKKELSTPTKSTRNKQDVAELRKEYEIRQGGKELINLVVIGHVDAGKSTLMGHLLYRLGMVNKKAMHKYETESKKAGKGSFAYAWVLDETEEERSRGVTMDIAQTKFETPKKIITLLDAPGHKDFIPNMITGAAQADVGILVVNATRGEFETGFESGGQTREHALLARSLGVSQLIVAANKMDTVDWAKERYDEVVKKLGQFLKTVGYKEGDISFVPCSGLSGENLTKTVSEPKLSSWYKGNTLLEQIDKFSAVVRPIDLPFRLCVGDVFKGMGSGFSVTGKICAGSVRTGDKVLVMPSGDTAAVKGIMIDELSAMSAFAGDHVTLTITGMDMAHVNIGSMLCDPAVPIRCATRIKARMVIFTIDKPITKGFMVVFHYQSMTVPAVIKKLNCQLHKSSGEVIKNNPKCLVKNTSAVVEIEFERPVCLEVFKEFRELGRFMLRYSGQTIAAGLVEEVLKVKSKIDDQQGASANMT